MQYDLISTAKKVCVQPIFNEDAKPLVFPHRIDHVSFACDFILKTRIVIVKSISKCLLKRENIVNIFTLYSLKISGQWSCLTDLISCSHKVTRFAEKEETENVVHLDFSKTSNTISHSILQ